MYVIHNLSNGKYYVGKTIKKNLTQYLRDAYSMASKGRNNRPLLHKALRKYGLESFCVDQLAECETNEQASELERLWIIVINSRDHSIGYNLSKGGEGSLGCTHSEEVRKRWGEQRRGRTAWNKGLTGIHSEAGMAKMVASSSGANNPFFGKTHSAETKAKVAEANRRRVWTAEARENMSRVKTGVKHAKAR